MSETEIARVNDAVSNRNGPKRVTLADGFGIPMGVCESLMPIAMDRHGRIWRYDRGANELVMIIDPDAAKF